VKLLSSAPPTTNLVRECSWLISLGDDGHDLTRQFLCPIEDRLVLVDPIYREIERPIAALVPR